MSVIEKCLYPTQKYFDRYYDYHSQNYHYIQYILSIDCLTKESNLYYSKFDKY